VHFISADEEAEEKEEEEEEEEERKSFLPHMKAANHRRQLSLGRL